MSLLGKTNPNATPSSVIRRGIIAGVSGGIVYLVASIWKDGLRTHILAGLPLWVLLCAGIGALMEWQIDDSGD